MPRVPVESKEKHTSRCPLEHLARVSMQDAFTHAYPFSCCAECWCRLLSLISFIEGRGLCCTMRFATAVPVLVALLGPSSSVQGRHVAHSGSRVAVSGRKSQQQQPNGASKRQLAQLQRLSEVKDPSGYFCRIFSCATAIIVFVSFSLLSRGDVELGSWL